MADGALIWQVACEYLWASRKPGPQEYGYADALTDIQELRSVWTTILPAWEVLDRVGSLKQQYGLSHWDALIVGTCIDRGVGTLYSEDLGGLKRVESVEIRNPFAEAAILSNQ